MFNWSSAVFTVSGCSSSAATKDRDPVAATLRAQLRRIAEAVYKLAKVTREEILSTSFEVVLVEHGADFDAGAMANAFAEHPAGGSEKVLCTTELGLRCVTRKGKGDGESVFEKRMLVQPKVVLGDAVDALVRE